MHYSSHARHWTAATKDQIRRTEALLAKQVKGRGGKPRNARQLPRSLSREGALDLRRKGDAVQQWLYVTLFAFQDGK